MEGRAFARHLRRGEAARGRAFADRAQRKRRGQIALSGTAGRRISGSPRSPRRRRGRGTRSSRATARRPGAARSRARSPCAPPSRRGRSATRGQLWPLRNTWNRATENLYSAWIEKLFDAPLDATLSWKALHEVLRDRSRNFLFNHLGLREDQMGLDHSPRLRRPAVLPARVFRVQDGAAVRVLEVLARRRRRAAEVPRVVEHSESRGTVVPPPPEQQIASRALLDMFRPAGGGDAPPAPSAAPPRPRDARRGERLGLAPAFGHYLRRPSPTASIPDPGERPTRRQHRLLSRAADAGDAAPGHRVRRSVRAHAGARAARAADGRRGGRLPRRRRPARRDGRAQALLARQFPVRAGSRARRPRVQALPADRAREERRPAAADQRRDREGPAVRRFFARAVAARRSRTSTIAWTT